MQLEEIQIPGGEISGSDLHRLVLIGGDLEYLRSLPRTRLLTHTEVRVCATILRRLFVDQQLELLTKRLGFPRNSELPIEAVDIDAPLRGAPIKWLRQAWAGGATNSGANNHSGLLLWQVPEKEWKTSGSPQAFIGSTKLPLTGERALMPVAYWLDSSSVAVQTENGLVVISRLEVLKYIANRKGGVHFDPRRRLHLPEDSKRQREIKFQLLDYGLLRIGHLSGPEYEVSAMAQSVADADWTGSLIRIAEEAAPDDFGGDPNELKIWTGAQEADGDGWATMTFTPPEPDRRPEVGQLSG